MSEDFNEQYDQYFENRGEISTEEEKESTSSASDGDSAEETELEENEQESENNDLQDSEEDLGEDNEDSSLDDESPENEEDTHTNKIAKNLKAALKEERTKRQDQDRQIKAMQDENAQIKQALMAIMNPQQPQQAEIVPDYEEDPLGYLKQNIEKIMQFNQNMQTQTKQQQTQQQQYLEAVNLNNEYMREKQEVIQKNPDFEQVTQYLERNIIEEYKALGWSEQQAYDLLTEDKISLLRTAKQQNRRPTEMIEQIAKARGFQPTKNSESQTKKLDSVKKGLSSSKSLSRSGGDNAGKGINVHDVNDMSDKEFNKLWQQYKTGNLQV